MCVDSSAEFVEWRSNKKLDAMNSETDFESQRDELIAEITAAFDSVSREDGTTLHET